MDNSDIHVIVDDTPTCRDRAQFLFKHCDYEVKGYISLAQASKDISKMKARPSVIVGQLDLPGLDSSNNHQASGRKRTYRQARGTQPSILLLSEDYMEKIVLSSPQSHATLYSVQHINPDAVKNLFQNALVKDQLEPVVSDAESSASNPKSSSLSKEKIAHRKEKPRLTLASRSTVQQDSHKTTYLLVDNNTIGNRFVTELLKDFNYSVKQYVSAADALDFVKERKAKIDIVLRCFTVVDPNGSKHGEEDNTLTVLSMSHDYMSKVLVSRSPQTSVKLWIANVKDAENILQNMHFV